jgi:hypothetical protein
VWILELTSPKQTAKIKRLLGVAPLFIMDDQDRLWNHSLNISMLRVHCLSTGPTLSLPPPKAGRLFFKIPTLSLSTSPKPSPPLPCHRRHTMRSKVSALSSMVKAQFPHIGTDMPFYCIPAAGWLDTETSGLLVVGRHHLEGIGILYLSKLLEQKTTTASSARHRRLTTTLAPPCVQIIGPNANIDRCLVGVEDRQTQQPGRVERAASTISQSLVTHYLSR